MKDRNYQIFKWILRSLVVVFFIFLLNRLFIFTGKVEYIQDFSSNKEYISRILPSSNASGLLKDLDNKASYQTLNQSTGYFNVKIPQGAEELDLEIKINQPVDEIDLLVPISDSKSDKKQVYNKTLNNLADDEWQKIIDEEKGLTLWQKNSEYAAIDDFLTNMPEQNVIFSVKDYNLVKISDYLSQTTEQEINWPLRGPHKIYTYIGQGEKLDWQFFYQELNGNEEKDPFILRLYYNDALLEDVDLTEHRQQDDFHLEGENLQEGIYLIDLPVSFDLRLSSIKTRQKWFALANRADFFNADIESNFYVMGDNIQYKTLHSSGYQDAIFNGQGVAVREAVKYYSHALNKDTAYFMQIPKSDLTVETDGFIFTDESQKYFIQQLYKKQAINNINEEDLEQIKYVLTDYNEPETSGNNIILKTSYDVTNVQLDENNNLPVAIYLSEVPSNGLRFYNIKATVHRSFIKYLKNLF